MDSLGKKIEKNLTYWLDWIKDMCKDINDQSLVDKHKQFAKNQCVSAAVKLVKKYFVSKVEEDDSKRKKA